MCITIHVGLCVCLSHPGLAYSLSETVFCAFGLTIESSTDVSHSLLTYRERVFIMDLSQQCSYPLFTCSLNKIMFKL